MQISVINKRDYIMIYSYYFAVWNLFHNNTSYLHLFTTATWGISVSHINQSIFVLIWWNYMDPWRHGMENRFFSLFILTIKILPLGPISSEQWCECNQPWPGVRSEEIMQHSRRHGAPPSSTSNTHCQGSAKLEKSMPICVLCSFK